MLEQVHERLCRLAGNRGDIGLVLAVAESFREYESDILSDQLEKCEYTMSQIASVFIPAALLCCCRQ